MMAITAITETLTLEIRDTISADRLDLLLSIDILCDSKRYDVEMHIVITNYIIMLLRGMSSSYTKVTYYHT